MILISIILSCNWNPFNPEDINDDTDTTEAWPDPIIFGPHENLNMFPLNIGNSWTYKYYRWMSEGVFDTITFTREIICSKTINSKEYFMFNRPLPFFLPLLNQGGIIDYDSLFFRENEYGDVMLLVDSLEYPFLIFDEETIDSALILLMPEVEYFFKLKSISDTVETQIDTFQNCYMILNADRTMSGSEHYIWCSPSAGPVKIWYPAIGTIYNLIDINIVQ